MSDRRGPIEFVYVAGPLTKGDNSHNVRNAIEAGAQLQAAGFTPFIPHLSWLADVVVPRPDEEWIRYDLRWLAKCDALVRLTGPSLGADLEVVEATRLGLLVWLDSVAEFIRRHRSVAISA